MDRLLLPLFITAETVRACVAYLVLHSEEGKDVSASFITLQAETTKLVVAVVCFYFFSEPEGREDDDFNFSLVGVLESFKTGIPYSLPAFLYLINNLLYFAAMRLASPSLVHVVLMAKLPLTAVAHHFIVRPQRNQHAWYSLICISIGLLVYAVPSSSSSGTPAAEDSSGSGNVIGALISLLIASISAVTGIATELLLKQKIDFWLAQSWLYFYGALFASLTLLNPVASLSANFSPSAMLLVLTTAVTGLIIATILRRRDNLVKLVGASICIATILITQSWFFVALRDALGFKAVASVGGIAIASWCYNWYKSIDSGSGTENIQKSGPRETRIEMEEQQGLLATRNPDDGDSDTGLKRADVTPTISRRPSEEDEPRNETRNPETVWYEPNRWKVGGACITVLFIAVLVDTQSW